MSYSSSNISIYYLSYVGLYSKPELIYSCYYSGDWVHWQVFARNTSKYITSFILSLFPRLLLIFVLVLLVNSSLSWLYRKQVRRVHWGLGLLDSWILMNWIHLTIYYPRKRHKQSRYDRSGSPASKITNKKSQKLEPTKQITNICHRWLKYMKIQNYNIYKLVDIYLYIHKVNHFLKI